MISRHLDDLDRELSKVALLAALPADQLRVTNTDVSAWSVAQQADHMLKVCVAMLNGVVHPGKRPPHPINMIGRAILLTGWIPRGRAKAPERVHGTDASPAQLAEELDQARRLLEQIRAATFTPGDDPLVKHPLFGGLTASQTLRTLVVHTRHHMRIVDEIRRG